MSGRKIDLSGKSIRQRLMMSFMLTTGLALSLASAAYLVTQYLDARAEMVGNLRTVARMLGDNASASLLFIDRGDAESTLNALQAQPNIVSGWLYDSNDAPFAQFLRKGVADSPAPAKFHDEPVFASGQLELFEPVQLDGERIGTVFIRAETTRLSNLIRTSVLIYSIVMIGALSVCYLGATLLRRQITAPLESLVEGSGRMAEGDLSIQVSVERDDELGVLAESFNRMVTSLRDLVTQVGHNSMAVASVSANLRESSGNLAEDSERQSQAVAHTAESVERINDSIQAVNASVESLSHTATDTSAAATQMDRSIAEIANHMDSLSETIDGTASSVVEMTGAVREIARNAEQLNESTKSTTSALDLLSTSVKEVEGNAQTSHQLSDQTAEQAELGARSVQQTVDGMLQIQTSFHGLEKIISDLAAKSESIGEVVKVIEGVVEQTNLLALNAAIISSQAGEHGRAFAVVADEVRSLAERTAGSTREISALIEAVQKGVASAVTAMGQGNDRVQNGVALSRQAGEILRVIGDSARTSSERIHEIVGTTARQTAQIGRVELAMEQLKNIAQQLNRGTHEQDNASADITRAVERMRDLGQRVKRSTQEQSKESTLITGSVEIVASKINQILEATTEQSKQGSQILEALQVFREVTAQGRGRAQSLRQSLDELSKHSGVLEEEVGRFRT